MFSWAISLSSVAFLIIAVSVASLGNSFIAIWLGYEFALFLGVTFWMLAGLYTQSRFWIEGAILAQTMGIAIPFFWRKH